MSHVPPHHVTFSIPLDFTFFSDNSPLVNALCGKNWKKTQESGVARAAKMVKIATVVASLSTFLISDRDEGSEGWRPTIVRSCQKGPLSSWSSSDEASSMTNKLCPIFIPTEKSCFFFFIETLSWWMSSQFCLFLRRGFFCRISDEVCLVINTALVKFSSQIFVGPRPDRGGGGYWQDLSKFLQHNNSRILSSEIVWE